MSDNEADKIAQKYMDLGWMNFGSSEKGFIFRDSLANDIRQREAGVRREALEELRGKVSTLKGCNCSAPDIGVGILHEPTCGLVHPDELIHEIDRLLDKEEGK